jgi:hypothetical protein
MLYIYIYIYIYIWKCHKETPCIAILIKQKCQFLFLQNQRTGKLNGFCLTGRGWYQWEEEGLGKVYVMVTRVQIFAHMFVNGKITPIETIPGMGEGGIKRNDGKVN